MTALYGIKNKNIFHEEFRNGGIIGYHPSWENRNGIEINITSRLSKFSEYKIELDSHKIMIYEKVPMEYFTWITKKYIIKYVGLNELFIHNNVLEISYGGYKRSTHVIDLSRFFMKMNFHDDRCSFKMDTFGLHALYEQITDKIVKYHDVYKKFFALKSGEDLNKQENTSGLCMVKNGDEYTIS